MLDSSVWSYDTNKWCYLNPVKMNDNPEYLQVTVDDSNRIVHGIKRNGDTVISGISILGLQQLINNNVISIEYDASTYSIYAITGMDSNVSISMDSSGNIYKETIID